MYMEAMVILLIMVAGVLDLDGVTHIMEAVTILIMDMVGDIVILTVVIMEVVIMEEVIMVEDIMVEDITAATVMVMRPIEEEEIQII